MGKRNGYWKTHQDKDLQKILVMFHEQGWRIIDPPKYYKMYCPCDGKHKTTLHLTPSGSGYAVNKRAWLERQDCYKEGMTR